MTAPLTMAEIMSATGHTLVNPDVLTRAEDLALRMVATGEIGPRVVTCSETRENVFMRIGDDDHSVGINGEFIGLDAAEDVAITLLALVAVARRDGNG